MTMLNSLKLFGNPIKAISFDVTGTLLVHKFPIMETYAEAAKYVNLVDPPSAVDLKPAFKQSYKENLLAIPCFSRDNEREWWKQTVRRAIELTGRQYSERDFNRYFRRIYQHYGSLEGYEVLEDTLPFLNFIYSQSNAVMGITTNTPIRTIETVLPMVGLHNYFRFFVCCQGKRDCKIEIPLRRFEHSS